MVAANQIQTKNTLEDFWGFPETKPYLGIVYNKKAGFDVPLPYYDRWGFEGKYTTLH